MTLSMLPLLTSVLLCATAALAQGGNAQGGTAAGAAQEPQGQDPPAIERLRRDQDEILRKAGRMRDLMDRLLQRYQREDKKEQVELLQKGLEHLERAGLLKDVASIRDDLAANALSDALRRQQEVVDDIERLLNILLQRRSIDNIEQEIERAGELADRLRELERRQAQLQEQTRTAAEREPNADEQALDEQLQQLAKDQLAEAQRNARGAGTRRPFLEHALQQVRELLRQQDRLEQRAEAERSGTAAADRQQAFDLGDLIERARDLATDVRDQERQQQLGKAAADLRQALQDGDRNAAERAKDAMESLVQRPPTRPDRPPTKAQLEAGVAEDHDWQQLREAIKKAPAGATPAERDELQQLAEQAAAVAQKRDGAARADNSGAAQDLAAASREVAGRLEQTDPRPAAERKPEDATPAAAARSAAEQLDQSKQAAESGDAKAARERVQEAMRHLEEARARLREQNPDAERLADQMAASADAAERELRNAPAAAEAESTAADALERAEQALRQGSDRLEQAAEREPGAQNAPKGSPAESLAESRQELQSAQKTLEEALHEAGADRAAEMAAGAERQQELRQRSQQAQQKMQQAKQSGSLTEEQQKAAEAPMQQADAAMQAAEQSLQQGEQSAASQQQQAAAKALQQAQQALQQSRPPGPEQQQAMQKLSEQQQQIEDEILRLAEELKQRPNPEARAAVDEAAEAARNAKRSMQQGEQQEADEQQARAREKLDEAARALEEERDRYLDQRQEELLFRMKEELVAFLEKHQPITASTEELQKSAGTEGLSRPARRKLNQFAEEEQALAVRLQTLVQALSAEGNLVYRMVLQANHDDLQEVARRLSGRNPDPASYTTMLQRDVERRTLDLLAALQREQKRREEERQQQQQQQGQQGENRFNPQRQKLVSLIAELEMLKQLELDTRRATDDMRTLLDLRGGDGVTTAEAALVERLLHRHSEVTKLFQQIKAGVEEALQSMQGQNENPVDEPGKGRGR